MELFCVGNTPAPIGLLDHLRPVPFTAPGLGSHCLLFVTHRVRCGNAHLLRALSHQGGNREHHKHDNSV